MRKKAYLICLFFLGVILFNSTFTFVIAVDEDTDGIDDKFENINKRHVEIDIIENEIRIDSIRRSDSKKDHMRIDISLNEFGIDIEFRYRSNWGIEDKFDLVFGIIFKEIIEFIDINEDWIFDPEVDEDIQVLSFSNFEPVDYFIEEITDETSSHHLVIRALNRTFTTNIIISEEFMLFEDSLITPSQVKINLEISSFNYSSEESQLALNVGLFSESNYVLSENTEDEEKGYSLNEGGTTTTVDGNTGYFSWNEFATVDEILSEISIGEIRVDELKEHGQEFNINYLRGFNIYHETKIGIEGLLIPLEEPISPESVTILVLIIGAVSVSVAYSVYHFSKTKIPTKKIDKDREEYFSA
ncbi:MAG: hypothetical protein ACXACB_12730, partial [Promethearchaeota archaeon]